MEKKLFMIKLSRGPKSPSVSKTELIIFNPKRKPLDFNMKIKLNGKRLYPPDSVKYLGIKIDSKLNWKSHVNATATKLNRANAMLYKVRDFVNANILKSIYYACIIWGQNVSTVSTFSRKSHLELSILKSAMLTPLLCFITLKLSKSQIKSRLRTVFL